ncbi:MAG: VWA domain-containing protein [Nitrospira sp.]|nr:MAG: VWA domain-containing protein [Nitrospira sp.]
MNDLRPAIDAELTDAVKRTPIILVLDTSGSMQENNRIELLNKGLADFIDAAKKEDRLADSVLLTLVTFGGRVDAPIQRQSLDKVTMPKLVAVGNTPMGDAVTAAIGELELQVQELKAAGIPYTRPWIVLMSDGAPTDDWQGAADIVQRMIAEKRLTSFVFGIPPADNRVLSHFGTKGTVYSIKEHDIVELLKEWLLGTLMNIARSSDGQKTLQIAAPPATTLEIELN